MTDTETHANTARAQAHTFEQNEERIRSVDWLVARITELEQQLAAAYQRVGEADAQRMVAIRKNEDAWEAAEAAGARVAELTKTLARAAYVANNLMGMIDRETWRAQGGDDGQGHYEGDYYAEKVDEEIREWAALAAPEDTRDE